MSGELAEVCVLIAVAALITAFGLLGIEDSDDHHW